MNEPMAMEPAVMKNASDCGVACLQMLLGCSYSQVMDALPRRNRMKIVKEEGLGTQQMKNIAARLGFSLTWVVDGDLSESVGILGLARPIDPNKPNSDKEGHWVVLFKGALWNPAEGLIWTDLEAFFDSRRWKPTGILVRITKEEK
jgi:ABC-type bacteriocin/lantibiotic exporter with double-glycine peptidase domain